jgi:hypothetical protein
MTQNKANPLLAEGRLAWSSRLVMNGIMGDGAGRREQEIERARANRPRTAHIEREIIWAVVVLYSAIIASFAALHLYGHFTQLGN